MKHKMSLRDIPFNSIKNGTKTIELRLYDEKRKMINVGDIICFTNVLNNNQIEVEVVNLHLFNSFEELYAHFNKVCLGYAENEPASPKDMLDYYSASEQQQYGVVGIEIKLIK